MGRVLKSQIEGKHVLPLVRQVVRTQVWMLGALTGPCREEHGQQAQRHDTYQRVLVVSLDYHVAFSHAIILSLSAREIRMNSYHLLVGSQTTLQVHLP